LIRTIIVDDEPTTENIIRFFAERGDLPLEIVSTARNGSAAIEEIRKHKPDLVFLDIQMSPVNGFEVMAALPDVRYVVVTAYNSFDYAQKALRLGAADILLKPIELTQLEHSVARATGWRFTDNDTVNEIVNYIRHHYAEKINLTTISQAFYLTQSHVARLFKKYMGESVVGYLNRVRIENAKRLLDEGMSVKNAAEQVGYGSLNNFYKHFKRYTDTTPASFPKKRE